MRVEYISHMGDDLLVVNAARVSLDKHHDEFQDNDEGLIKFLARNQHWTPFGHPHICLRVTVPIFVARQLMKHKVGFTNSDDFVENEISRRYVDSEPEFYIPDKLGKRSENKKQGAVEGEYITALCNGRVPVKEFLEQQAEDSFIAYKILLEEGIAAEDARMVLPLNTLTSFYWTGSLFAYSRMYNLRRKEDAQRQTREIAEKIAEIIAPLYPHSWAALTNE